MTTEIGEGRIDANGITFAYLHSGEGPLVLLLHGFPDNAWTWRHQLNALAGHGLHAVAPFLRGYPPTEIPEEPPDTEVLARDVKALIEAFGQTSAHLVGHDWGAIATFNAAALFPESVERAVSIGVGHPGTGASIFRIPPQLHYSFHIWLFQLEGLGELALQENDYQLIDYLWRHWSFQDVDEAHVQCVKNTFRQPGVAQAAIAHYRALLRVPFEKPAFFDQVTTPTSVPFSVIYGQEDPAKILSEAEAPFFTGPYERFLVPDAGHFVQLEQPAALSDLLVEWLAQPRSSLRTRT